MTVIFGLFGLVVGSFLNVCIYRLPRRESVVWPGSKCTSCLRSLLWFENIPLVSWLVLKGRCRTCRTPIATMYPAVEFVTAFVFAGSYVVYGMQPLLLVRIVFACAMIVLFVIDYRHRILPDAITLPGIIVGFGNSLLLPPGPAASLYGLIGGGASLWLLNEAYYRIRGHEGLGMGDVKMLAMIGAFLGWKLMVVTLFLGSFSGSLLGLLLISFRKGSMQSALPFGTFLALGALAATVFGDWLVDWYTALSGLPS